MSTVPGPDPEASDAPMERVAATGGRDGVSRVTPPSPANEAMAFSDLALIRLRLTFEPLDPDRLESDPEDLLSEYLLESHANLTEEIENQVVGRIPGNAFLSRPIEIRRGSLEILLFIGTAVSVVNRYNEIVETLETAVQNTRRIVERLADLVVPTQYTRVTGSWVPGPRLAGLGEEHPGRSWSPAGGRGLATFLVAALLTLTYLVALFVAADYFLSLID